MPNNILFLISFTSSMVVVALILLALIFWMDRRMKKH